MMTWTANTGRTPRRLGAITALGALLCMVNGCNTDMRYRQTESEFFHDPVLSSHVKRELKEDRVYKYPGVKVSTFKSVVQLSGFVKTEDQKKRAEEIAKHVSDVLEVRNNITVKE